MSHGQSLYRDVWEQRPPGIYWVYLAGFQLLGWAPSSVAWIDILSAAFTTLAVYLIGRGTSNPLTGAAAAAFYAVLTMPAWLYGHGGFLERAVSETFIVLCVCWMAWLATRWARSGSTASAFAFGLLGGTILIFKPNAGLYFPALIAWAFLYAMWHADGRSHRPMHAVLVACAAALVLPGVTLLWLWQHGLLHDAKIAVVDFNRFYVGEGFDPAAYAVAFSKAVFLRIKTEPLWLIGAAGAVAAAWELARHRRLPPPLAGLAVIWGAAVVCVIVVNGARLFNSYFIQALPPLALLGAWFVCGDALRPVRRVAVAGVLVLSLVLLVQRDYAGRVFGAAAADLGVLTGRTDPMTYLERFGGYANQRGYSARANAELATYVAAHTQPGERIFLFGINGAGVYFAADRLSAHRFLRVNFFGDTDFPDPSFRLDAVVADLAQNPPRYLIFERLHSTADPRVARVADNLPADPMVAGLLERYTLDATLEDFTLYRRVE